MKKLVLSIMFLSLMGGCAKNRDREPVRRGRKENVLTKASFLSSNKASEKSSNGINGRQVWWGKLTVVNISDSPSAAFLPVGFQGNLQLGYFDFTENQLQFRSLKGLEDGVETGSIKNPVLMNWNIHHLDYALDEVDGQTTNREIESDFKVWDEKRFFRIDWNQQQDIANSVQMFPATARTFFGCWKPVNIRQVPGSMNIEEEAINFNVEVVYQANLATCGARPVQWVEGDLGFTATFKYSFRRRNPTPGFTPKFYSNEQDPNRYKYGHFQSVRRVKHPQDGRPHNVFMENRWPEKTHHFYYVKGFPEKYKWLWDHNKPESVLGQTNALLKAAGSKLRFEIHDYNHQGLEREFGDLRYSFVNFMEQLAPGGSVLGYGPSDADPLTGEIIAANTMVWTSSLDRMMRMLKDLERWNQGESPLVTKMNEFLKSVNRDETVDSLVRGWDHNQGVGQLFQAVAHKNRYGFLFFNPYTSLRGHHPLIANYVDYYGDQASLSTLSKPGEGQELKPDYFSQALMASPGLPQADFPVKAIDPMKPFDWKGLEPSGPYFSEIQNLLKTAQLIPQDHGHGFENQSMYQAYFKEQSQWIEANQQGHCMMDGNMMMGGFSGRLKDMNSDLNDPQVIEDILNTILYRVSMHEFGHNLNLRHNFYGSVDQSNFDLGKEESIANFEGSNGLKRFTINAQGEYILTSGERVQNTSSQMDYLSLADELNTPWAWESYDVAAILDAYAPNGFDDKGRLYLFCTDEHTPFSPICKGFDVGTTPSEILMSQIRSYDEWYRIRNHRYGRAYWNTRSYASGMIGRMMGFKQFLPFWRTGLSLDILLEKMEELGVEDLNVKKEQVQALDQEMVNVTKLSLAFFSSVIQPLPNRETYPVFDETTGALKIQGTIIDKIFASLFLVGDSPLFYNPNRIMIETSYLTYSDHPALRPYTNRLWRGLLTDREILDRFPGFVNFNRFLYAKNATNYSNRDNKELIDIMKVVKIDTAEDLKREYGVEMPASQPVLITSLLLENVGVFRPSTKDEKDSGKVKVAVIRDSQNNYYMVSTSQDSVPFTLVQNFLSKRTSLTQLEIDIKNLQLLYQLATSGHLQ